MTTPAPTPITILDKGRQVLGPNQGRMTIKLPLSGTPDQDWKGIFQNFVAQIFRPRGLPTPRLDGAEIGWEGTEAQVPSALQSIKAAVDNTNTGYPAAAARREAERAELEQQQAEAARRHGETQKVVDDFVF